MGKERERIKRRIYLDRVLTCLLVINILAGILFSRITAIRRVNVENVPLEQYQSVTDKLQYLKNTPILHVSWNTLLTELLNISEFSDVDCSYFPVISNLTFQKRKFVANIDFNKKTTTEECCIGMTADGKVIENSTNNSMDLIKILLSDDVSELTASFTVNTPLKKFSDSINIIQQKIPESVDSFNVDSKGNLIINLKLGGEVLLGNPNLLDEKIDILHKILHEKLDEKLNFKKINLINPRAVTYF